MEIREIAQTLVDACNAQGEADLLNTYYATDAVSVEPMDMGNGRETHGVEAIHGKHAWWEENFEVHSLKIEGPYIHGEDRFAVTFEMDCTEKASSKRETMKEVAVYSVTDGKITREEFFY